MKYSVDFHPSAVLSLHFSFFVFFHMVSFMLHTRLVFFLCLLKVHFVFSSLSCALVVGSFKKIQYVLGHADVVVFWDIFLFFFFYSIRFVKGVQLTSSVKCCWKTIYICMYVDFVETVTLNCIQFRWWWGGVVRCLRV